MHVVLVLDGEAPTRSDLAIARRADAIVCADGGARPILAADLRPTIVIGDMDSAIDLPDVPVQRHPAAKDETDGELALDHALGLGPERITIIGGHGGRTAMFLANLKLLRRAYDADVDASMHHGLEIVRLAVAGQTLHVGPVGATLNVLAIGDDAIITLTGTAWDIKGEILEQASARGVSNTVRADDAAVAVHEGVVLVIIEADRDR